MNKILAIAIVVFLTGCSNNKPPCDWRTLTVETVYRESCTNNADAGFLTSGEDAECRVLLSNGDRANIESPVMEGDTYDACYRDEKFGRYLWRSAVRNRSALNADGIIG